MALETSVSTERDDEEGGVVTPDVGLIPTMETDPQKLEANHSIPEANSPKSEWKPGPGEWAILACLAIVSLVVALDATILVPVLPVCFLQILHLLTSD